MTHLRYVTKCMCPSTLCTLLSLFVSLYIHTSSVTLFSPLPAQQKPVSISIFMHVSIHFVYMFVSLYILHDTFFTITCTKTGSKYSVLAYPSFLKPLLLNESPPHFIISPFPFFTFLYKTMNNVLVSIV